jgi:hypothetical protein
LLGDWVPALIPDESQVGVQQPWTTVQKHQDSLMISIQIIIRRLLCTLRYNAPTTTYYTNLSWQEVENRVVQVGQDTAQTAHQHQGYDDEKAVGFDRIKQVADRLRREGIQHA